MKSRVRGLIVATAVFGLGMVFLFASQLGFLQDPAGADGWLSRILFFESFYLDFILFLTVGVFLVNGPVLLRMLGYGWCFVLVMGYLLQWHPIRS